MAFSMFSANTSPIAIDFGTASVKLLQTSSGDRPSLVAAAELQVPESIRFDVAQRQEFFGTELPSLLKQAGFKGKRVCCTVPGGQTFVQHMQIVPMDGVKRDDIIKAELQAQTGCAPHAVVVRGIDVTQIHRDGQTRTETICLAIARDAVMRHVNLLKRCRLEVVGVHTDGLAMVRAFDHLNRRDGDENITTLYVDLGWGGTRAAIAHGKQIVFARAIQLGGMHFDQHLAQALNCDVTTARSHRLSLRTPAAEVVDPMRQHGSAGMAILDAAAKAHEEDRSRQPESAPVTTATKERRRGQIPAEFRHPVPTSEGPTSAGNVDLTELLDIVADELSMGLRYHRGLFPDRRIDRVIYLGGEARQTWLCQYVTRALRLSAQLGDPIARLTRSDSHRTPGVNFNEPQPGWAVACGLCNAPTDL